MDNRSEWWASPPKVVGPLVLIITIASFLLIAFFILDGKFQEALLTCGILISLLLASIIDLLAQIFRYAQTIIGLLEKEKNS
jgi:hypothetical protein